MPTCIRGTAHPPAGAQRVSVADLSSAELATQRLGGLPLHVEHDTSAPPVGRVQASWTGRDGELRVAALLDDPTAERLVRSGRMRGLSLGTEVIQSVEGQVLRRAQSELSVCEAPRRAGCFVDTLDGKKVHTCQRFSAGARAKHDNAAPPPPSNHDRRPDDRRAARRRRDGSHQGRKCGAQNPL